MVESTFNTHQLFVVVNITIEIEIGHAVQYYIVF